MKMVKSLLLGSATGIVAVAGAAQAADLPVKAAPVEYVRICSAYGAGFYYIPGTDTCLKVGGQVHTEWNFNAGGGAGPHLNIPQGYETRIATPAYRTRTRAVLTLDARTQTEYGTLRSYIAAGWESNSGEANYRGQCFFSRAFIQFAGITAGKTRSFFDFYSNALNYSTLQGGGKSTGTGINLIAYTAQFGGGFSATLSIEDGTHNRAGIWDASIPLTIGAIPGGGPSANGPGSYAARTFPEIVGNLRVDQPWGSAQISGAVRDASGGFHNGQAVLGSQGLSQTGWAVSGGLQFNLPWAQGDTFWIQGTYTRGATQYLGLNPYVHTGGSSFARFSGGTGVDRNVGLAWALDGLYDQAGGGRQALVEGWSVLAAAQHFWQPNLRTSVFGHYTQLNFGATGRDIFCNGNGVVAGNALTVCNPDFNIWQVGSRTVWSPVRNLDIGVEILYTKLDQKFEGQWGLAGITAAGGLPAGAYTARDQDIFSGTFRITRAFWP